MALVSNGRKNGAPDVFGEGPVRHWHTVGLDIPRPVARLQSPTLLLQAMLFYSDKGRITTKGDGREVTRSELKRRYVKIESGTQVASRGPTWRMATPLV